MAVDPRQLLAGLEEYRRSLTNHVAELSAEYQELDNVWHTFSAVYEGDAADQFKEGWIRTAQRFQEYIEQTRKILGVLDERITDLREYDRPDGATG